MLSVIILTRDEAVHIERAIASVKSIADQIIVVDSGSVDETCQLARDAGAKVLNRPWLNYATQFNWALDRISADAQWVLRLDADEIVSPELRDEITRVLPALGPEIVGIHVPRHMNFQGGPVRKGGLFPVRVLRLFRANAGRCEARWMDEHIQVTGKTRDFQGQILDDNLKSLSWWIEKHNGYASREVVDLLNLQHQFLPHETIADAKGGPAGRKRWAKEKIYARFPPGLRAILYFLWRFIIRLGFLDSAEGRRFHLLQGLWYRYLVDLKLRQVQQYMRTHSTDPPIAIHKVLGIDVN